jgi:hypothetical protein
VGGLDGYFANLVFAGSIGSTRPTLGTNGDGFIRQAGSLAIKHIELDAIFTILKKKDKQKCQHQQ